MSIDDMIAVLQAAKAGKQIQRAQPGDKWVDAVPCWDFALFDYRVKPEPREWWLHTNVEPHWLVALPAKIREPAIHVREVLK